MTMGQLVNYGLTDLGWVPFQALFHKSLIHFGPVATEDIFFSGIPLE